MLFAHGCFGLQMAHDVEKSAQAVTVILVVLLLIAAAVYMGFYGIPSVLGVFSGLQLWEVGLLLFAAAFLYLMVSTSFWIILNDYERIVLFTFGTYSGVKGPGFVFLIPFMHTYEKVDLRTQTIDLPKQDVITMDKIEAQVDTVLYMTVKKPENAILKVEDYEEAAKLFIISSLRDEIGKMTVDEVISNRDLLNEKLTEEVGKAAKDWGVEVDVEIKDVDLPEQLIKAMHSAQAAKKEKEAMITRAEGKKEEIDKIRAATHGMTNENIVYYYLQALEKLAEGKASKLVVPMELTRVGEFFSGRIQPRGSERDEVKELIDKYAGLIKAATKGDAPKEVQKAIQAEGAPAPEEARHEKLFKHHYNALRKAKKKK